MKSSKEIPPDIGVLALRKLLDESTDLHRAITADEVDGFIVGDDANRRVLLLANAYQRYRQLVERMEQGAVTVSAQGNILYANQPFASMLDLSLAQAYTSPLEAYTIVSDRARLSSFLMVAAQESEIEVMLRRRDHSLVPVKLSLVDATEKYATLMVTDMRTQWRAETVEALVSILDSLAKLRNAAGVAPEAREALGKIVDQTAELVRRLGETPDEPESNAA